MERKLIRTCYNPVLFPTLYHRAKTGKVSVWEISVQIIDKIPTIVTVFGYENGTKQAAHLKIPYGKNIGRSNQTSPWEQAVAEAKAKWEKKQLENYRISLEEEIHVLPMLAHKYTDHFKKVVWPCYVQPKLNGCLHHATKIQTNSGIFSLGEIVKNKMKVSVLSYNEKTNITEYKPILNWFENGESNIDNWTELKLADNVFIKCTLNHKVFTQRGWVEAKDLDDTKDTLYLLNYLRFAQCKGVEYKYYFPVEKYIKPTEDLEFVSFKKQKIRHVKNGLLTQYDIEVADNHNYFANNLLVHNCRVLAHIKEGKVKYISRKSKEYETLHHWDDELINLFPNGTILDGESFHTNLSFQEIIRRVKRVKTSRFNIEDNELQYWIYDVINDEPYKQRLEFLRSVLTGNEEYLEMCPTFLINDDHELKKRHAQFTQAGFEGSIIRNVHGLYQANYRSYDLLKYKDFMDKEYRIVGGTSATGKDEGTVIFQCVTDKHQIFNVRPRGTWEQRKEYLDNIQKLVGKMLTVRYQEMSEDGIPIFPIGLEIRDYE